MGASLSSCSEKLIHIKKVDFPPYRDYALYGNQSTTVPGTGGSDRSKIYRMSRTTDEDLERLRREWYEGNSCLSAVENMCRERGSRSCFAYRRLKKIEKTEVVSEDGRRKVIETYVFEPKLQLISYDLLWSSILSLGRGLHDIGLKKGDTVAIFEETRWEWMNTLYSCWSQGLVVATVYANLGDDALEYALAETQCNAIVCNGTRVNKVLQMLKTIEAPSGTKIVYLDELPSLVTSEVYDLCAWSEVLSSGKTSTANYHIPNGDEDKDALALIMYTSGTTGTPKGVMHTHGSLYSGCMTSYERLSEVLGTMRKQEWYCSYLPLAHIMELVVTSVLMMRGVIIGYGRPRTLLNNFAKPCGDLAAYRPLLLVAVPRIFESMRRAVEEKLPPKGSCKHTLFDKAYRARLRALKEGLDLPLCNKVFAAARKVMGGRVYVMLSGGGPLSASTQEFINVVFGMVVQGWGMTETVCCGSIQRGGNLEYHSVGQIVKTGELQLLDTEEFKHTDQPEARGEVLLRGPFLFKGYYKQPEQTKAALDEQGWLHTGDVAAVAPNGTLRIIGRVKALAKNANGEYLALETLESIYGTNEIALPNGVCVLVNPHRSYITLLALTNEKLAKAFMQKHNITGKCFPDILEDTVFVKNALSSFQKTARDAGRCSFEIVQAIKLLNEEWTPENGILTSAMKLKRRAIDDKYSDIIAALFEKKP